MIGTTGDLVGTLTTGLMLLYVAGVFFDIFSWRKGKEIKIGHLALAPGVGVGLLVIISWLVASPLGIAAWVGLLALAVLVGVNSNKWLKLVPMPKQYSAVKKEEWVILWLLVLTTPLLSENLTRVMLNQLTPTTSIVLFSLTSLTLGVTSGLIYRIQQRRKR